MFYNAFFKNRMKKTVMVSVLQYFLDAGKTIATLKTIAVNAKEDLMLQE